MRVNNFLLSNILKLEVTAGTPERGRGGEQAPLQPFLMGQVGQKCPSLTVFILMLATVFQPENTTKGTLCLKLTEIHPIALLPYQYKAST